MSLEELSTPVFASRISNKLTVNIMVQSSLLSYHLLHLLNRRLGSDLVFKHIAWNSELLVRRYYALAVTKGMFGVIRTYHQWHSNGIHQRQESILLNHTAFGAKTTSKHTCYSARVSRIYRSSGNWVKSSLKLNKYPNISHYLYRPIEPKNERSSTQSHSMLWRRQKTIRASENKSCFSKSYVSGTKFER